MLKHVPKRPDAQLFMRRWCLLPRLPHVQLATFKSFQINKPYNPTCV
jgi:hypothetical protein